MRGCIIILGLFVQYSTTEKAARDTHENLRVGSQTKTRTVTGAGASFPVAVYEVWLAAASAANKGHVTYTYEAIGSGKGKAGLLAGTSDFAGSDSRLSPDEQKRCPECWFVPSLAGAVAVVFNLPDFEGPLQVPRSILADIFQGKIDRWSALAQWNPGLAGLRERIRVYVRADKSGTTEVFTSALASFSSSFEQRIGPSNLPAWPNIVTKSAGTSRLARQVLLTEYSIGYMSIADAKKWELPYAKIQNKGQAFTEPSTLAVQEALEAAMSDDMPASRLLYQDIVDPDPAAGGALQSAYPIAGLTYLVFNPAALDCETLLNVLFLVYWALTDSQAAKMAEERHFASIPEALGVVITQRLGEIKCNGKNLLQQVRFNVDKALVVFDSRVDSRVQKSAGVARSP